MAHIMKAIQAYSPRVKVERMVEMDEVIQYITDRTGLNTGELYLVLMELRDCLFNYTKVGYSVRLPGLGSFAPTIEKSGVLGINHRPDKWLISRLNEADAFIGTIRNKDMIGESTDAFIERWNEEHPNDKIKKK